MAKIKGYNAKLYIDDDLLAHSSEVTFNFDTDTEEVTDEGSGDWAEILPTLNRWNLDATVWYHNAVATGGADFDDLMTAYLAQSQLTLKARIETGTEYTGVGFLTNLSVSGGTGGAHITFTASFTGTGEIS